MPTNVPDDKDATGTGDRPGSAASASSGHQSSGLTDRPGSAASASSGHQSSGLTERPNQPATPVQPAPATPDANQGDANQDDANQDDANQDDANQNDANQNAEDKSGTGYAPVGPDPTKQPSGCHGSNATNQPSGEYVNPQDQQTRPSHTSNEPGSIGVPGQQPYVPPKHNEGA